MPHKSHLHDGQDIMQPFRQLTKEKLAVGGGLVGTAVTFVLTELPSSPTKHEAKGNSILCRL
jgi:hypothetical protein